MLCLLSATFLLAVAGNVRAQITPQNLSTVLEDIPVASRILAQQGVVDAYGHVSGRNPENSSQYIMSRNLAPALVTKDDLVFYNVEDASPVDPNAPRGFLERLIHASMYKKYPNVQGVVHFHAEPLLPFGIIGPEKLPLRAADRMAAFLGASAVPVFEIRNVSGDASDVLIRGMDQSDALADQARSYSNDTSSIPLILMRGHGATTMGATVRRATWQAIVARNNAQTILDCLSVANLDDMKFLTKGEVANATESNAGQDQRPWPFWSSLIDLPQ